MGTLEIDFTGGDPYPYRQPPPVVVDNTPPTKEETAVALILGVGLIGLLGYAIYKAPKTAYVREYRREPSVRIRL